MILIVMAVLGAPAAAEIVISANDGKQVLLDGAQIVPAHPAPDSISILDLDRGRLRVVETLPVATSVIGPPRSVAITPDGAYAIVTAARRIAREDPTKIEPDDQISLIDLRSHPARVVSVVHGGAGPAGVAIGPSGTRVLVANRAAGTVSLFALSGRGLSLLSTIPLGDPGSSPAQPIFFANGARALVTRDGDHRISVLAIEGTTMRAMPRALAGGLRPYAIDTAGPRRFAVVGNIGGGGTDTDTISLIDLTLPEPRVVDTVAVGLTPEGLKMSPDGRFVAVNVNNGSNNARRSPTWSDHGELQVWRIDGGRLHLVTSARIGGWGQAAAWSKDGRTILVQTMLDTAVSAFAFDGHRLRPGQRIELPAGPAAMATVEP
jgi:DNA-binding beta-propeller fold protein YncE